MPGLYWKDMDNDVGHLSPLGLLILAPLSHWSRLAEQNLNCRLNLEPPPTPEDRGTRWESEITSQPSLCRPFPFSRHRFTSAQRVVTRRNTCGMVGKAQTHIGCWISERKQGESVRPMAGLRVDYRTPEEIFLSPQMSLGED